MLFMSSDDLGYIEYDKIYDKWDEEIGCVHDYSGFFSTKGTIYTYTYYGRDEIGTYDSSYWYDDKGRPVAEVHSYSIQLMKTPYVDEFKRKLFK